MPVFKFLVDIIKNIYNFFCRLPQKRLAEQVTMLVHGEEGLKQAEQATAALYESSVEALGKMKPEEMPIFFGGASLVEVLPEAGQTMVDIAMKVGCFPTKRKYKILKVSVIIYLSTVFFRRRSSDYFSGWILCEPTKD